MKREKKSVHALNSCHFSHNFNLLKLLDSKHTISTYLPLLFEIIHWKPPYVIS